MTVGEYVYIPVHITRAQEVIDWLSPEPGTDRSPSSEPSDPSGPKAPDPLSWTDAEILRAYEVVGVRSNMRQMLDLLADRPDEWVPSAEVYTRMGIDARQLSGVTGSFMKMCYGRFQKADWFLEKDYDQEGLTMYRMPGRFADIIHNA